MASGQETEKQFAFTLDGLARRSLPERSQAYDELDLHMIDTVMTELSVDSLYPGRLHPATYGNFFAELEDLVTYPDPDLSVRVASRMLVSRHSSLVGLSDKKLREFLDMGAEHSLIEHTRALGTIRRNKSYRTFDERSNARDIHTARITSLNTLIQDIGIETPTTPQTQRR